MAIKGFVRGGATSFKRKYDRNNDFLDELYNGKSKINFDGSNAEVNNPNPDNNKDEVGNTGTNNDNNAGNETGNTGTGGDNNTGNTIQKLVDISAVTQYLGVALQNVNGLTL